MNWIFSQFRTGFLLPVQLAKINLKINFCRLNIQFVKLDFNYQIFQKSSTDQQGDSTLLQLESSCAYQSWWRWVGFSAGIAQRAFNPHKISLRKWVGKNPGQDVPQSLCSRTKKVPCPAVPLSHDKSKNPRTIFFCPGKSWDKTTI